MVFLSRIILITILVFLAYSINAQNPSIDKKEVQFYADYMMGTYLLLDDVDYKSVFLNGFRLGIKPNKKIAYQLEYLTGNQEDRFGVTGTTHTANLQLLYFLNDQSGRLSPYIYAGGGFFEFKDFSNDVLGVAFNGGFGSEFNISKQISALAEFRYVNLGPLNLQGVNQIGVLWGVRLKF